MVVPMPKLSPQMSSGRIARWLKQEGDEVQPYDVLLEVSTSSLVEDAYKVDNFAGEVTMLVEAQEGGRLVRVLHPEAPTTSHYQLPVGTPIALIVEDGAEDVPAPQKLSCPTTNVYDEAQPRVRVLEWQSYLKHGSSGTGCS